MPSVQTRISLTSDQIAQFHSQGYLILDNLLTLTQITQIIDRFEPLFNTEFETGIYPDEWYGRPGLSQPNATRQMTGLWRCDRTLAGYTLSSEIARLNAILMGWPGARYAYDACWIKPPDAPEVSFHRNNTYVSTLNPASIITCWIALSHATPEAGTLEIVPRSHQWACSDTVRFLHAPKEDYRTPLWQAVAEASIQDPDIIAVKLPPGSGIFLHGNLWHGSGRNRTTDQTRHSLAISTLPPTVQFQPPGIGQGYIFSRYRRLGRLALDESFFPILWHQNGYRTPFLADYCDDLLV
ncbi:MAG: phytanoyl-CoA dioxygenase family protein [Leptolyngbya sp. SIO1D8]|nr:phytanoyl-CoA dioxygenase family protein [Leptolyngbya sp. SIO1D8]